MNTRSLFTILSICFLLLITSCSVNDQDDITVIYTVTMDKPNTHYYHVSMAVNNMPGDYAEFKLPNWTPGYYCIMDYAKNVTSFEAADVDGGSLEWEKTNKNTWKVHKQGVNDIVIEYDVYSHNVSVAEPYLDYGRAFISPAAIFMYPSGRLNLPSTIKIIPYHEWESVCTGLEPVEGVPYTFYAGDYDILFDSPILAGNMKIIDFEIDDISYTVSVEKPGNTDLTLFINDLRKVIPAATGLIGDIPYEHYTFLIMDRGMGGLEHANSMAVYSRGDFYGREGSERNKGWMNFITHEFFHLYNVKSIRPAGLWPIDYDKENYTDLLWVSEGFTVYYEYIIMNRAGLLSGDDVLNYLGNTIRSYESIPGSDYQSVAESSFDTWINFFSRSSNAMNATISYYHKGCALGMLLDLAIRHETGNEKSLDDVMRKLYYKYYKDLKRGFTGDEFRTECELIAGTSLDEIFDVYVSTTADVDYNKYLAYAGLDIDLDEEPLTGSYLGAETRNINGETVITSILRNSPAWEYGLSVNDVILEVDGQPFGDRSLSDILRSTTPLDTLDFKVKHRYLERDISVITDTLKSVSYKISALPDPDSSQLKILNSWIQ
ncbi:MAG: PDZ domain-containing protein [Bacteroidota bacterium]|nr:PDZ domain-containing protein [Bacteroidota bacterium]